MKKQLVIVGITLVLLIVALSGCNENGGSSIKNKFVGKWTYLGGDYLVGIIEFYSDGLARTTHIVMGDVISTHSATWEIKDDKLIINELDYEDGIITYRYNFSNDETLVLTEEIDERSFGPYTYKKS